MTSHQPIDSKLAESVANAWFAAWNTHDLEAVLSHGKITRVLAHYEDPAND